MHSRITRSFSAKAIGKLEKILTFKSLHKITLYNVGTYFFKISQKHKLVNWKYIFTSSKHSNISNIIWNNLDDLNS